MDRKKLEILAPGDSIKDAFEAQSRLTRRARIRALVAKRRYERTLEKKDEQGYLLAAQEYYYMSALFSDFRRAALETLAQFQNDKAVKDDSLN